LKQTLTTAIYYRIRYLFWAGNDNTFGIPEREKDIVVITIITNYTLNIEVALFGM